MKSGKKWIKFIISSAMLALVLSIVDFAALKETLWGIPAGTLVAVIVLYVLGQIISSYKWWLIARSGRIESPYPVALKSYFIGMFVNSFGFGTVGGDVARGVLLADGKRVKTEAVASVVADRAHGLCVLALLGIGATLLTQQQNLNTPFLFGLYGIAAAIILGWILGPKLLLAVFPKENRLREKVEGIAAVFPKSAGKVAAITVISVFFHLLQISIHAIMAAGLGVEVSWTLLLVTIPFVNILSSLPFSWQGLGVREASYLFFLGGVLSNEQAVAFGAMWFLGVTVSSAAGGIVSAATGELKILSREQLEKTPGGALTDGKATA